MILTKYDRLTMHCKPIPAPTIELVIINHAHVARDYAAGATLQTVSSRYSLSINAVRDIVFAAGVEIRGPMCGLGARYAEINESEFLTRYKSGEQIQILIAEYKIGRARANEIMARNGVKSRTTAESVALKKLRMAA